jgi:hypothetical protein
LESSNRTACPLSRERAAQLGFCVQQDTFSKSGFSVKHSESPDFRRLSDESRKVSLHLRLYGESAKGIHRFTAQSAVLLYDMPDGVFDIHYVDAAGNEIPPDKALAAQFKVKPARGPVTTH